MIAIGKYINTIKYKKFTIHMTPKMSFAQIYKRHSMPQQQFFLNYTDPDDHTQKTGAAQSASSSPTVHPQGEFLLLKEKINKIIS